MADLVNLVGEEIPFQVWTPNQGPVFTGAPMPSTWKRPSSTRRNPQLCQTVS